MLAIAELGDPVEDAGHLDVSRGLPLEEPGRILERALLHLARQAHPTWSVEDIKLAITNTADPGQVSNYATRLAGAGLVQVPPAAGTRAVARGDRYTGSLNFGVNETLRDLSLRKSIRIDNHGEADLVFNVANILPQGAPHSVVLGAFILFFIVLLLPVVFALVMPMISRARYGSREVNRVIR